MYAALGAHAGEALGRAWLRAPRASRLERRRRRDGELLAASAPPAGVDDLYRRSLLVLETLTDRRPARRSPLPNAIRASPTRAGTASSGRATSLRPPRAARGGPRRTGGRRPPLARPRPGAGRAVAPAATGSTARWRRPGARTSWTRTRIALFAYEAAWRELADETLDSELWPPARAAGSFLARVVDDESGCSCRASTSGSRTTPSTPTPRPLLSEASVRGRLLRSATSPSWPTNGWPPRRRSQLRSTSSSGARRTVTTSAPGSWRATTSTGSRCRVSSSAARRSRPGRC